MADVVSILDELQNKALKDEKLKQQLLATRTEEDPLSAFCKTCRNLGYELYEMELIAAGEEFHAAMKRSTNGGGENSRMKIIFMSYSLQIWRKCKITRGFSSYLPPQY